jgi:hypothetical protein
MRTVEFAAPRKAKRHKTNFTHKDSQSRPLAIAARSRAGHSVSAVSILAARLSYLLLSLDSWMLIRCSNRPRSPVGTVMVPALNRTTSGTSAGFAVLNSSYKSVQLAGSDFVSLQPATLAAG